MSVKLWVLWLLRYSIDRKKRKILTQNVLNILHYIEKSTHLLSNKVLGIVVYLTIPLLILLSNDSNQSIWYKRIIVEAIEFIFVWVYVDNGDNGIRIWKERSENKIELNS